MTETPSSTETTDERRFTDTAWEAIEPIGDAIDDLPFLRALEDGTLPPATFAHYLAQDAAYLGAYARVLATAASRAPDAEDTAFWSAAASNAITVERLLHQSRGVNPETVVPSPTCTAYTSYLMATATTAPYPVVVAAVLPCFWIYDDVGRRLIAHIDDLTEHPYADWISTYGDPAFTEATVTARAIADRAAAAASPAEREHMRAAFATASRYEWMFWDAAWHHEQWPV